MDDNTRIDIGTAYYIGSLSWMMVLDMLVQLIHIVMVLLRSRWSLLLDFHLRQVVIMSVVMHFQLRVVVKDSHRCVCQMMLL